MKIVRRLVCMLVVCALLLSFTSCFRPGGDLHIVVTDQAGRTVTIPQPVTRVVSCYYVTTYALLALGSGDLLVGIEKKANSRPIYAMVDEGLLDLPAVGSLKEIDVEAIAALSPDLVILPKKLLDSAAALEDLGISTLIVNPETNDDLRGMFTLLGTVLEKETEAAALRSFYDTKLNSFSADSAPSVLFLGNSSFLTAAPTGMYQNTLISLAGGSNAFAESNETYWQEISYETFLRLNPDYIVLPSGASYTVKDLQDDEVLCDLDAVAEGRVVKMPGTFEEWDSPIPSAVLGVLWLRAVLHSDTYSTTSLREDIKTFYETFYGFTPKDADLDSCL